MKLAGLYSIRDIPRLRANHRAFAERNMMDYVELFCGNFYEKWALVYWLLDSEPHETFVFIDAFSYFVSPDFDLDCSDPVVIQELNGKVMDNFFVVRSCPESRKLFSEVGTMASQRFIGDLSFYFDVPDSAGVAKPYGFRTIGGKHFNVDLGCAQEGHFPGIKDLPVGFEFSESGNEADGALDAGEMLVATFAGQGWVAQCGSVAEVLCCHRCHLDQPNLSTGLEVVNPGCERALLTLSCCEPGEPFPDYVSVSERNLRRYAKEANVTLYLYKGIPPEYAGLHSTWTKPYLALRHLVDHGYLSWVDGDVLLSRDFALPEGQDVVVYKDPGAWLFNAGFITFRRSEKTFDYLRAVIARCEALDDRSSLYVNGSDQTQFIEEFQAHFPDLLPRSNLVANIPILLQSIRQAGPGLWHFMGLNPASIRTVVMDYYDKYVIDSHLSDRPAAIKSKPGKSETARPTPGTKEIESQTTPSIHGFARIADKAVGKMWLINLPRRADRLEKFKANHPDLADCINVLPAYDGKKLGLTPKIARLFAPNDFGWNKATMGCSLSHLELWQKLADEPAEDARYLILEDDTRLSPEWLQTLQEAFARQDVPADWDVLYLGGVLPHNETVFAQCKEQVSGKVFRVVPNGWFGQQPPNRYFHFGAYAYLLSKNGARKMLEFIRLQNGIWPQADYILSYVTPPDYPVQTSHYFLEPLLAHCYQDMESGYSRSYEDKGQPGKIDSDIWKESSAFDEAEAKRLSSLSESYDIPGALAEARAQMQPLAHAATAKISLLHATRGRPDQALEAKELWLRMARHPERVEHLFALDDDDESAQPLRAHPHVVQEEQGFSVGAWNLAASRCTGDILVQLSDDWLPPEGWDDLIAGRLDIAREEVLWISDGHRQDDLMCMAILTRKYHARHGLFDPAFRNVFSDNDFTVRAQKACAVVDGRDIFIKHNHPFAESARELDATYQRGNQAAEYERARAIYEAKHSSASAGSANSIRTENHSVPAVPEAHHAATAKISLLHATRGRPTQALEAKELWLRMAHHPERIEHLFAVDDDDESAQPLRAYPHVVQKEQGFSVGAWNLAASRSTGDILMQMSDDCDPPAGWDDLVAGSLDIASERVLWINGDYTRNDIMCMAILTRKYYEKYGLFDPRFKNVYSDDDFTAKAKKRSAITYANNIVFKHKHFTTGDSPVDATYQRCNDHNEYHRAKILFDSIHNAAHADGGDAFTGDNHALAGSAVFVGCAKDCGAYLPAVLRNIERIASLYSETAFVFVENDSTDGTKQSLRDWVTNREKAILLELDGLPKLKSLRTDRMASARNAYLDYIRKSPFKNYDYLLVFDFDHVNSGVLSLEEFRKAIRFLESTPEACAVLPVSDPVYYDIWALRHPELCPDDCWANVREYYNTESLRDATERFVYSRQQSIDVRNKPIQVVSAFGGLGIYRLQDALASEYIGTTTEGAETCEHVKFSEIMTARSGRHLYIFPQLRNWAPPEHQRPVEVALRKIHLEQDGARCEILAPQEHPLDRYRQTNPLYDRRLPLLARLAQEKSPDGAVIDIGANIGDTIALLRLAGVRSPIFALEPSPNFFSVLKANIETQPSLFGQVQALHAFAGDTTHTLRLEGGTGTASSQQMDSESSDRQPMHAPTIPLENLGVRDTSIIKVDTDGYDASILRSELPYITRTLPIIWTEADIKSAQQHAEWINLLQEIGNIFECVCVFDNFGFLITHGRLSELRTTVSELLRYTYRHASLPAEDFGQPRINYLDLVLFPSRWSTVYSAFIESLPEASK